MIDSKLVICVVGSIVAHFALERGLEHLPRHVDKTPPQKIDIRVVSPPVEPPVEPPKPPDPEPKPEPKPEVHEVPHAHPVHAPTVAAVPRNTPPPDHSPTTNDTSDTPVFGASMESMSTGVGGPAMQVGNTVKPQAGTGSAAPVVKALAEPVAAFEATKMPLPQARCFGKYTDEARAAGIEGVVVLDLIVGEDGRVRDVKVVEGLEHGLSAAAIAALHECRFSPGEKDGKAVAVKIRGFKIHFVLQDSN